MPENITETFDGANVKRVDPGSIFYPGANANYSDCVDFLLRAKKYVRQHMVPEDRQKSNNQYSHAGDLPINHDTSTPALTNCCYKFYGSYYVSIGFPMFIDQTPFHEIIDKRKEGFTSISLGGALYGLLNRYGIIPETDLGEAKAGFYRPKNHRYFESKVNAGHFEAAQEVVRFLVQTSLEDPKSFLNTLDQKMKSYGYQAIHIQKPPTQEQLAETSAQNPLQCPPHQRRLN